MATGVYYIRPAPSMELRLNQVTGTYNLLSSASKEKKKLNSVAVARKRIIPT
jgi:hypothetical protein